MPSYKYIQRQPEAISNKTGTTESIDSTDISYKTNYLGDAFGVAEGAELSSWSTPSGVLGVRQYTESFAFDPLIKVSDVNYSAGGIHNHADSLGMSGFGEISVILNGIYYQARHQDYRHRKPVVGELLASEYVSAPDIPDSIKLKSSGLNPDGTLDFTSDTQAKYFKNIYKDNPGDVGWYLAYAEMWLEPVSGTTPDAGDSFRHSEVEGTLEEAYRRGSILRASGHKHRQENLSFGPAQIVQITESGEPIYANPVFRIMTYPVGNLKARSNSNISAPRIFIATSNSHAHELNTQMTDQQARDLVSGAVQNVTLTSTDKGHTHNYVITFSEYWFSGVDTNADHTHEVLIEGGFEHPYGNIPYDEGKAIKGVLDNSNRFQLVRDVRSINLKGSIDDLIKSPMARFHCADLHRLCEMIPGIDGEGAFIEEEVEYDGALQDSFGDRDGGTLNAAYYNHRYRYGNSDAAGRTSASRGFSDPNLHVARTTNPNVVNGYTYMIPLELLLRSPIEHWNPHGIADEGFSGLGTEANPYTAFRENGAFFKTPINFYSDNAPVDPADTARTKWMTDNQGNSVRCWASGTSIFTHDGEQRLRFPVYPVSQQFSYESTQTENLKVIFKEILKRIQAGTATQEEIDAAF